MRVQRDGGARAEAMPHHEVGHRDQAMRAHQRLRHRMPLDGQAKPFQQRGHPLRMRRAIARRVVRRGADERREEGGLAIPLRLQEGIDARRRTIIRHGTSPVPPGLHRPSRGRGRAHIPGRENPLTNGASGPTLGAAMTLPA